MIRFGNDLTGTSGGSSVKRYRSDQDSNGDYADDDDETTESAFGECCCCQMLETRLEADVLLCHFPYSYPYRGQSGAGRGGEGRIGFVQCMLRKFAVVTIELVRLPGVLRCRPSTDSQST